MEIYIPYYCIRKPVVLMLQIGIIKMSQKVLVPHLEVTDFTGDNN